MSDFPVSSDVLEQWRNEGGERVTFSEAGWIGASVAVVMHATLSFFSVAIEGLDRFLVLVAPPQWLAFALTEGSAPIARWMALIFLLAVWGAAIASVLLAITREATDSIRARLGR